MRILTFPAMSLSNKVDDNRLAINFFIDHSHCNHHQVVNVVYGDRESALDAAAAHCLARLQATFQVKCIAVLLLLFNRGKT